VIRVVHHAEADARHRQTERYGERRGAPGPGAAEEEQGVRRSDPRRHDGGLDAHPPVAARTHARPLEVQLDGMLQVLVEIASVKPRSRRGRGGHGGSDPPGTVAHQRTDSGRS
jgi:hypothetical protein